MEEITEIESENTTSIPQSVENITTPIQIETTIGTVF
jgi:hypothetical protein